MNTTIFTEGGVAGEREHQLEDLAAPYRATGGFPLFGSTRATCYGRYEVTESLLSEARSRQFDGLVYELLAKRERGVEFPGPTDRVHRWDGRAGPYPEAAVAEARRRWERGERGFWEDTR